MNNNSNGNNSNGNNGNGNNGNGNNSNGNNSNSNNGNGNNSNDNNSNSNNSNRNSNNLTLSRAWAMYCGEFSCAARMMLMTLVMGASTVWCCILATDWRREVLTRCEEEEDGTPPPAWWPPPPPPPPPLSREPTSQDALRNDLRLFLGPPAVTAESELLPPLPPLWRCW